MNNNAEYDIAIWDIQFYKVDEDGNPLTDNRGNVQLFTEGGNMDLSYVAEHVTEDELWEIES